MTEMAYPNHPAYPRDHHLQRLWHEFLREYLRDAPDAVFRLSVYEEFRLHSWAGVDEIRNCARELFGSISPSALKLPDNATDRQIFKHALRLSFCIFALASRKERDDLWRLATALQTGLFALYERENGFNEPFFSARPRGPKQPRESLYVRKVKAISAEACEALMSFGVKDAAKQVADVLNKSGFLPAKTNGKSVVARSVLNWRSRLKAGNLKFSWLQEKECSLFPKAYRLARLGRVDAARRRVLRFLPIYIEAEKRAIRGN